MDFECVREICNNNPLIALYLKKRDTDKFFVGFPVFLGLNCIKVMLLDSDGASDGFAVCSLDLIYRIEIKSNYLKSLTEKSKFPSCPHDFGKASINNFFEYVQTNEKIIRLYDYDMQTIMFGIPISFDSDNIIIQRICINGRKGKLRKININDVAVYMYDSKDELSLYKKYLRKAND